MKILFLGDTYTNCGPANVNKKLIAAVPEGYCYMRSRKNVCKFPELVWKLLTSDAVVISGITRIGALAAKLAGKTGTKAVYIMHGDAAYETQLNGKNKNSDKLMEWETEILLHADLLLPVSERFSHWVKERYPQYANKTRWLFNGVEKPNVLSGQTVRNSGLIVAAGGDRSTKNNAVLAGAVSAMEGNAELKVYGTWYSPEQTVQLPHIHYMGVVPQDQFFEALSQAQIFVLNSVFEPFSLAVIDALNCGCSVLVSTRAGIADLLPLEAEDLIRDPMDPEEIRHKIAWLLEHPNNARLAGSVDYDALSYAVRAEELTAYCRELIQKR